MNKLIFRIISVPLLLLFGGKNPTQNTDNELMKAYDMDFSDLLLTYVKQ